MLHVTHYFVVLRNIIMHPMNYTCYDSILHIMLYDYYYEKSYNKVCDYDYMLV